MPIVFAVDILNEKGKRIHLSGTETFPCFSYLPPRHWRSFTDKPAEYLVALNEKAVEVVYSFLPFSENLSHISHTFCQKEDTEWYLNLLHKIGLTNYLYGDVPLTYEDVKERGIRVDSKKWCGQLMVGVFTAYRYLYYPKFINRMRKIYESPDFDSQRPKGYEEDWSFWMAHHITNKESEALGFGNDREKLYNSLFFYGTYASTRVIDKHYSDDWKFMDKLGQNEQALKKEPYAKTPRYSGINKLFTIGYGGMKHTLTKPLL